MRHVKTVEVSGRVIGADGKPATHADVQLAVPEIGTWSDLSATTDETGKFTIKRVPSESYILEAQQGDLDKHYMARQKLEVGNEKIESLVIVFGRGATVGGRVTPATTGEPSHQHLYVGLKPHGRRR